METQSLASIIRNQNISGSGDYQQQTSSFNTFLTVYSINLAHRFSDVYDLNKIDTNTVRSIAEFSLACSTVALGVWDERYKSSSRQRTAA